MHNFFLKKTAHLFFGTCQSLTAGLLLILAAPLPTQALEFECSKNNDTRFIRQELPGINNLCEVTVTKSDNERKVMWYANQSSMFCTDKTLELKNKYVSKWGFDCGQWPDHDGVDQLSDRQRTILDAELKFLIAEGKQQAVKFSVEGLKAAASGDKATGVGTLVVQFFLYEPASNNSRDVTHIIQDDGAAWKTVSRMDALSTYIDADDSYTVNSALISAVSDSGAMEIITVIDTSESASQSSNCYGNQILETQADGNIVSRTPHRYVCVTETSSNDSG